VTAASATHVSTLRGDGGKDGGRNTRVTLRRGHAAAWHSSFGLHN